MKADFLWRTKRSFKKAKQEIEELKLNVGEWIVFLDSKDDEIKRKMIKMENRIERLEEALFRVLSLKR